jgi:hypothetical protein
MTPKFIFKNLLKFALPLLLFLFILSNQSSIHRLVTFATYAIDTSQYEKDLADKEQAKKDKEAAMAKLRGDIDNITQSGYSLDYQISLLDQKVTDMENQINQAEQELQDKEKQVAAKQAELDKKQLEADKISKDVYKNTRVSVVELFLNQLGNQDMLRNLKYREYFLESQIANLKALAKEFEELNTQKKDILAKKNKLEVDKEVLAESRGAIQMQRILLQQQLAQQNEAYSSVNNELNTLSSQITELQRQIVMIKAGGTIVNVGNVPATGDYNATLAGFRESAPNGYFAVFSIGSYSHRNGMSQSGAQARAESGGQSVEQILQAYFPGATLRKDYPIMGSINVIGYGMIPFETQYLYGIAEMPENWNINALKAQAILARTYAIKYTSNGALSICTTEACQAYNGISKTGAWKQAVDETAGWVLVDGNGNPILSEYAAVHGGYINGVGWDTTDGAGGSDWVNKTWESQSGHPWFYKAWYRQGYSDGSDSCGRMAWMSPTEMADIVNAFLATNPAETKAGFDFGRVRSYTACGGGGGTAYTPQELQNALINPVTTINGSPISIQSDNGQTQSVIFDTNRGLVTISGSDFKSTFNMRSPNYLLIPQFFGWTSFNVERK